MRDPTEYLQEETAAAKRITKKRWADRLVPDIEDADIVAMLERSSLVDENTCTADGDLAKIS